MKLPSFRFVLRAGIGCFVLLLVSIWLIARIVLNRDVPLEPLPSCVVGVLGKDLGYGWPDISCCTFSPDSETLIMGAGREVRVWDVRTLQLKAVLKDQSCDAQDAAFSLDGRRLVTACWERAVGVWDTETWERIKVIDRQPLPTRSVAFSPDGSRFAVGGGKGQSSVQMYDTRTLQCLWSGRGTASDITHVSYSPDGLKVVTADRSGVASFWDPYTGRLVGELQVSKDTFPDMEQIGFGADSSQLIVRHRQRGRISLWNLETKDMEWEERPHDDGRFTGFAVSADRKLFARMWVSGRDPYGKLELLKGVKGEVIASVQCRGAYLNSICFSPNGKLIATGGQWDRCVGLIWDVDLMLKTGVDAAP